MPNKRDPWFRNRKIRDSIHVAIHEAMRARPEIVLLGEGSHMKYRFDYPQLLEEYPERIITTPICEDAEVNFAVGLSLAGMVPIVDIISSDFLFRALDSIANTAAKQATVSEPRTIIIRAEFLTGGPTSGQRIESLFAHVPGLRVGVPSNPVDAYEMMQDSLQHKGVTLLFEDRMISDAELDEQLPYVEAEVTIASYGITQHMMDRHGWPVFGLKWLCPLKIQPILDDLNTTGRLLIVEPCPSFLGIGAELAAQVAEALPGAVIRRLGAPRCTIPASRELHDAMLPTVGQVRAALKELENSFTRLDV